MGRRQSLLVLGVWLIVVAFSGFPSAWRTFLFVVTGLALIALYLYQRSQGRECTCGTRAEVRSEIYVDNRNSVPTQQ